MLAMLARLQAGVGVKGWGRNVVRVRAVLAAGIGSSLERISNALAMRAALRVLAEASSKSCGKW